VAVLNHFIDLGERHSLDNFAPSFASLGSDDFLEGFRKVVTVIAENYGQWQTQLSGLKGLEARYQPRFNLNDSRKQLRDLYVSNAFQKARWGAIRRLVEYGAKRVCEDSGAATGLCT
jgi:hypothetical protein